MTLVAVAIVTPLLLRKVLIDKAMSLYEKYPATVLLFSLTVLNDKNPLEVFTGDKQ